MEARFGVPRGTFRSVNTIFHAMGLSPSMSPVVERDLLSFSMDMRSQSRSQSQSWEQSRGQSLADDSRSSLLSRALVAARTTMNYTESITDSQIGSYRDLVVSKLIDARYIKKF